MESVVTIANQIKNGEQSAEQVLEKTIADIARKNPVINAFAHLDFDYARNIARQIDNKIQFGEQLGPLAGVPFAVKDLEDCAGMPTGMGCSFYSGKGPVEQDMLHVHKLRMAGAIPLGKTTTAELGFAGDCHTKACGTTRNPWNPARTPGGSSGGSAAAVAAGMLSFATGSDGGGSIRGPAAFTGLVGFKPSHGRIARSNGMSENSCYGSLNTNVQDTARCLDVMAGPSDKDRTSLPDSGIRYEQVIESLDTGGLKVTWSDDLGFAVVSREVIDIARKAAEDFIKSCQLIRVDRTVNFVNLMPTMMVIYGNLMRNQLEYQGFIPDRFDELADTTQQVLREVGECTPAHEIKARENLATLEAQVAEFFTDTDILMCPATACTAFNAEGPWPREIDGRDASETFDAPMTPFANYCWNPSISLPAGFTKEGLPVGLLITGKRHRDDQVLRLARLYEQCNPWPLVAPENLFLSRGY